MAGIAADHDLVPGLLLLLVCLDIALLKKFVKMETIMIRKKSWLQSSSSWYGEESILWNGNFLICDLESSHVIYILIRDWSNQVLPPDNLFETATHVPIFFIGQARELPHTSRFFVGVNKAGAQLVCSGL